MDDAPDVIDEIDETPTEGTTPVPEATPLSTPLPRLTRVPGGVPDMDAPLQDRETVMLRLQPDLYNEVTNLYRTWKGVAWIVEMTPSQAEGFRHDLNAFIVDWVASQRQV